MGDGMVKVTVGTATNRKTEIYPSTTTVREILDSQEIDYSTSQVMLDGANIGVGSMDKSLSALGVGDKCMLVAVIKTVNA
jgi:hypothetical protein